jgi:hypothetical protein
MRRFIYFGGLFIVESVGDTFYYCVKGVKAVAHIIYNTMSRKAHAMPVRKANMFAALASDLSDSSSDSESSPKALAAFSELKETPASSSPPFRVWKVDEGEKRFTVDNSSIFSSPFSRKKVSWSRPRFKNEDADGWVSIQVGLPPAPSSTPAKLSGDTVENLEEKEEHKDNYDDCPDYAPPTPLSCVEEAPEDIPTLSLPPQEFPSLLVRGLSANTTSEDQRTAMAWAEKIKNNLEKAERARVDYRKNKDETSRFDTELSFFRKAANTKISSANNSQ